MNEKEARDGTTNTYGSKYMKDFTFRNFEQIFKRARIIFACALIISLLSLKVYCCLVILQFHAIIRLFYSSLQ